MASQAEIKICDMLANKGIRLDLDKDYSNHRWHKRAMEWIGQLSEHEKGVAIISIASVIGNGPRTAHPLGTKLLEEMEEIIAN